MSTGKTSIATRWNLNVFSENNASTAGIDTQVKTFATDKYNAKILIVDTAGQEKFKATTSSSYRKADFVCFVFSYDDEESFSSIKTWITDVKQTNDSFIPILIGNKSDLGGEPLKEKATQFA